jgi:hypothetical protein
MEIKFKQNYIVEIYNKNIKLKVKEYIVLKYIYENRDNRIPGYMLNDLFNDSTLMHINNITIPKINLKCGNIILETRIGNCYYIEK